MKNKSVFFVFLLFMSMAHAQDTVSEGDPWYLFNPHVSLIGTTYHNPPSGNAGVLNQIQQYIKKDSGIVVYGIATTATAFPFNIETVYPPTMILYRHRAAGNPPSIAFVDSANAYHNMYKSCFFYYEYDNNGYFGGYPIAPCHEFYFNTPHPLDNTCDTFYISTNWPQELYLNWRNWFYQEQNGDMDKWYCLIFGLPQTQQTWWVSVAVDSIMGPYSSSIVWGGIFPIVKLRCVSPRLWLSEQGYRTTTVAWRQNDTPEQYQLAIGHCGSMPDSGTSVYTTDTTYTFTDLEPDTCYSVWVRKACRYTTAGYDTVVWSNWSNELIFTTVGIDEVEGQGVRIHSVGNTIVVEGAEGKEVRVYDMMGREVRNEALPAGVYMVRVGDLPARKVVVMR